MVDEGMAAPDFELATDDGQTVRLSALKGRRVVLYFYPKDDTPGCTSEAKDFTCLMPEFEKARVEVIGVSPDGTTSHAKFRDKHGLAIRLASDEGSRVAQAYGVWGEKSMYGRKYMGVERSTFLIGRDGKVAKCWRKVKVPGHAEAVLEAVRDLAR
jgi:thioredoxin-dependent peroxiredoxin